MVTSKMTKEECQVITKIVITTKPLFNHCYASLILEHSATCAEELNRAIKMCEDGLHFLPVKNIFWPSLKHILGKLFYKLYTVTNNFQSLTFSIHVLKESITHLEAHNLTYGTTQFDLGLSLRLLIKHEKSKHALDEAIVAFQAVCNSPTSNFEIQYKSAIEWAKLAEEVDSEEALTAYEYVMNVLPHLASLSLDIKNRHQRLIKLSLQGISSDAASCAIKAGNIEKAVEFLEHGRSIFWQQAMNLQSSTDILQEVDPDLVKELATLSRELNISSFYTQAKDTSKNYQDFLNRQSTKRIDLSEKWNKLLEKAQSIPGCEVLFKPISYSKLTYAALNSIIVILSVTARTSHAIVIESPDSHPASLELPSVTRKYAEKMALALQDVLKGSNLRDAREIECLERAGRPLFPFTAALGERKMYTILSDLWARIVKPVLDFIKLKYHGQPTNKPAHITWCCTDILATLPIHAAGVYQGPDKQENLFEYAISSYTSTLSNLLSSVSSIPLENAQILLAGMEKASGYPVLPNVIQEIQHIQKTVVAAQTKTLMDSQATCINLLENMANAHLVHLACHGIASPDPLDSAIILHDGHLKIDKLIRVPFKNAKLVFLSACQTAKVNPLEADESIHIAAAMLTAGFKSVVATLWSINDCDAPIVAKAFYGGLIGEGCVNVQDAALALHRATDELRKTGVSPLRWVPFIHMGV
ncbi:CHAT domain-containing protein [Cyathus striatus]|nr:CHAT domain-containing protein [Cyathus striatus]